MHQMAPRNQCKLNRVGIRETGCSLLIYFTSPSQHKNGWTTTYTAGGIEEDRPKRTINLGCSDGFHTDIHSDQW